MQPSLDGRRFRARGEVAGGDVSADTTFEFSQQDNVISARYAGGSVVLGFLVGRHLGETVEFRYAQLTTSGDTASGHSVDRIEVLPDGRLLLHEEWEWDSRDGAGTSVLEELPAAEAGADARPAPPS